MVNDAVFSNLNLNASLQNALADAGFVHPTTIQQKVFSKVMSGADVCGIAQTGTGKTIAYLLPLLRLWTFTKNKHASILILVPTRELVAQVVGQVELLSKYMNVTVEGVYGGVNMNTQKLALQKKIDVIVATPGRLYDLAIHGAIKLNQVKKLVIDEVDEMLNLGFRPQLMKIMDLLPERRQNLLFSATLIPEVEEMLNLYFTNPEKVETAPSGTPLQNIEQQLYHAPNFNTKINLLNWQLQQAAPTDKILVFASSKKIADLLFEQLAENLKENAAVIHSNKDQNNRFRTVNAFESGEVHILIATDVIARGIDVNGIHHVINFDVPIVAENYMHRIGRTGRAQQKGLATLYTTPYDQHYVAAIEALMQMQIPDPGFPAGVEESAELIPSEMPQTSLKEIELRLPANPITTGAFQPKAKRNLVTNNVMSRKDGMMKKYGKPQKRRPKK